MSFLPGPKSQVPNPTKCETRPGAFVTMTTNGRNLPINILLPATGASPEEEGGSGASRNEGMDEQHLVARCQAGDLAAFNTLVERYQHYVYSTVYRMIGSVPIAEDVTQDAFIAAWKNVNSLRGGNFRAWVVRIAVNAGHDYLRRTKRRPERSLDAYADDPDDELKFPSNDPSPEDSVLTAELGHLIQDGLALLPDDQRTVLVLSDIQGMSYDEIADVTGAALGTVKSRLSRARTRLREFLLTQRELLPDKYRPSQ